jgi:hypothetical protein
LTFKRESVVRKWLCEKLICCETTSATRGRTMEHGGYYQLR